MLIGWPCRCSPSSRPGMQPAARESARTARPGTPSAPAPSRSLSHHSKPPPAAAASQSIIEHTAPSRLKNVVRARWQSLEQTRIRHHPRMVKTPFLLSQSSTTTAVIRSALTRYLTLGAVLMAPLPANDLRGRNLWKTSEDRGSTKKLPSTKSTTNNRQRIIGRVGGRQLQGARGSNMIGSSETRAGGG